MKLYNLSPRIISFKPETGIETRFKWDDGSETVHYDVPEKINCEKCNEEVRRAEDIVRYEGLCGKCFPEIRFGVPFEIKVTEPRPGYCKGEHVFWKKQVDQTFTSGSESYYSRGGADFFGNNFGLHDLVVYDPNMDHENKFGSKMEGVVLDIHQYNTTCSYDRLKFLVRTYFNSVGKVDIFSDRLEAMTCSGLKLNEEKIASFQKALEDVSVGYDPGQNGEGEAFEDPVARTLLMSYKMNHLVETRDPPKLNKLFCDISGKFKEGNIPRERIHLWLKKQLRTTSFKMSDEQIAALIPFIIGEKEAGYHLDLKEQTV